MMLIAYLTMALAFYVYLELEEFLETIENPHNTSGRGTKIAMALIWPGILVVLAASWVAKKLGL